MPGVREIKRRIQSVKSTRQITKAMKMVSAAKLYKSQKNVLAARPYSEKLQELFSKLSFCSKDGAALPLLGKRDIKHTAVILVTGNRGFVGGFNHTLTQMALAENNGETEFIAVGSKGRDVLISQGCIVKHEYCSIKDVVSYEDVAPLGDLIVSSYEGGQFDCVKIIYQKFLSAGKQEPTVSTLLPISNEKPGTPIDDEYYNPLEEYIFEGDSLEILNNLSKKYVYNTLLQAIMECKTSEHIARMTAMNSSTDNATEMMKKLQMDYNRSRQAAITREIAEISGCTNTMK